MALVPSRSRVPAHGLGSAGRIVVIAPHPDDEVLAAGGTIRRIRRAEREVVVVAVTDGEASHPRSRTLAPAALAERRVREQERALGRLGVEVRNVVRLRLPDGLVAEREGTLTRRLASLLRGAAVCLAPWECDGHPDHDATGRAAHAACGEAGVPLARYLVWAWHWSRPAASDVPWGFARRTPLDPDALRAKRLAIACHKSQIAPLGRGPGDEPVLPGAVLARFQRPFETVLL